MSFYIEKKNNGKIFIKWSNVGGKNTERKVFYFVWTFIYSIHQVVHRVIYQLFIPFVIYAEKSGTNNYHLILLGTQSSLSLTKKDSPAGKDQDFVNDSALTSASKILS